MTSNQCKVKAYELGVQDARQGRVYRHSACPGSWVRYWLVDYDKGWNAQRVLEELKVKFKAIDNLILWC